MWVIGQSVFLRSTLTAVIRREISLEPHTVPSTSLQVELPVLSLIELRDSDYWKLDSTLLYDVSDVVGRMKGRSLFGMTVTFILATYRSFEQKN